MEGKKKREDRKCGGERRTKEEEEVKKLKDVTEGGQDMRCDSE